MLIWMTYAATVGLLVTGAVSLAQSLLRNRSGGGRWVWATALVATSVIPLATTFLPDAGRASGAAAGAVEEVVVFAGEAVGMKSAGPRVWAMWAPRIDSFLTIAWGGATLLLFGYLAGSVYHLRGDVRRWPLRRMDGATVRVGTISGPAVVGIRSPVIVVPRWVLDLPASDRRLILAHEQQHVAARDPLLMGAAWLLVALTPWSPGLWIQLRRLRGAMEADCDRRVVRGRPWAEVRRYGQLLVDVGTRVAPGAPLAPASFAEGGTHLEWRLRTMFELYPPLSRVRTLLATAGALGLAAAVFLLPGPDRSALLGPGEAAEAPPFTHPPELVNAAEVRVAIERGYPALLRDAGIGGTAEVWLYIDTNGQPTDVRVDDSSGHGRLDEAALQVAGIMRFEPAMNENGPVAAWLSVPIRFAEGGRSDSPPAIEVPPSTVERGGAPPAAQVGEEVDFAEGPTFTPFTVRPEVTNREAVGRALEAAYPPLLRDAGIGGTARVWFFIDATGGVQDARIERSSGHRELDAAALEVAKQIEFSAALNREQPVPVWVAFPITFQVREP